MSISNLGDLAVSFQMRRDTARIRTDLVRVAGELSSGVVNDVSKVLKGDFSALSGIEYNLARSSGYRSVIDEYTLVLTTQQAVVQKLREIGSVSGRFLTLPDTAGSILLENAGAEALSAFEAALRGLNTQAGGRVMFSGVATNQPAVADADSILAAIETDIAAAGATSAVDIEAVVDGWFATGGAFESIGYAGGPRSEVPVQLSDSEIAQSPVTAEDGAIRQYLASLALSALVGRTGGPIDPVEQELLIRRSGEKLLEANDLLVALQARIGTMEGLTERASVEVNSQVDALEIARAGLIETDPFEAATELQNAEAQLQTIYTLTSRLSRLSLVEYLR